MNPANLRLSDRFSRRAATRLVGTCAGAVALAASAIAVTAPVASAAPNWDLWNVDLNQAVAASDILSGDGTLIFTTNVSGFPVRIECQLTSGSTGHTVSATDQLSAAPRSILSVPVMTLPAVISSSTASDPEYDVCEDISGTVFGNGVAMDVAPAGSQDDLVLNIITPPPVNGVYPGVLGGAIDLPSISFWDPSAGCGWTTAAAFPAVAYDAGTAVLTATPNQALTATGCTATNPRLESATITLDPHLSVRY